MGRGVWAIFRSLVESFSEEVTLSTELNAVREKAGRENRLCKGPEMGPAGDACWLA